MTTEAVRLLESTPEGDGHHYEVIAGELTVTPSPTPRHQAVLGNLFTALNGALDDDLRALQELNLTLPSGEVLIPDVVVVEAQVASEIDPWVPSARARLVVEVLSPSTQKRDLVVKRDLYLAAGLAYWVVDVDARRLSVYDADGRVVEVYSGDDIVSAPDFPMLGVRAEDLFR